MKYAFHNMIIYSMCIKPDLIENIGCIDYEARQEIWTDFTGIKVITKHMHSFKNHTIQNPRKMRILRFFSFNNAFADITYKTQNENAKSVGKITYIFLSYAYRKEKHC